VIGQIQLEWVVALGTSPFTRLPVPASATRFKRAERARNLQCFLNSMSQFKTPPAPSDHILPFPPIMRDPGVLGGEPTVRGTRVSVRTIVAACRGWGEIEHIMREYPQLECADVEEALEYFKAHRPEIDRYIRANLVEG
jgi:uncharacterized protein (DUF433 family)